MKFQTNHFSASLLVFSFFFSIELMAQEQKAFATVDEVLTFTKNNNYEFKNNQIQVKIADLLRKGAAINIINPKVPASTQVLNNINQQVSFLPGEAFGQQQGTFKEVTIGQQYVSTFSIQPQFDIINFVSYSQLKSAKANQLLVENQNKINEQNLYEKINMVYFNIISLKAQKNILLENVEIAKDILRIIQNKFNEGLARKQELNEAQVNLISLQDKLEQIELNITLQNQILDLFFENQINALLTQNLWEYENYKEKLYTQNSLLIEHAKLQSTIAQLELKASKYQNLPVLGFVSSFNWQNLSNNFSFAQNSNWINFNFIGLRLSYDLPTTTSKYISLNTKKLQTQLAVNNQAHIQNESLNRNNQLLLEYQKALKQEENFSKIFELKKDTYEKNFNQFKENILPLDKLLISQNDMLISKLNMVFALTNIGFNKSKIDIYNKF
jgi:outer membrane protein TolC